MSNSNNKEKIPRLLVIDDNLAIHEDFKKILMRGETAEEADSKINFPKYAIDFASQGEEGLELVKKQDGYPYSVAFVDMRMPPGLDRIETVSQIWNVDSRIQMVICTAYPDYSWEDTMRKLGGNDNLIILKKPFDIIEVRQIVFSLARKWQFNESVAHQVNDLEQRAKEESEKLANSLAILRTTLESTADGIVVSDNNGIMIDYNTKFVEMYQVPINILESGSYFEVIKHIENSLKNNKNFISQTQSIYSAKDVESFDEIYFTDGRVFERYSFPHRVRNNIVGRVWNYRDVTKYKKMQESLAHQQNFDHLTEFPNRNFLEVQFKKAIEVAAIDKKNLGVLSLNLDRIKIINDSLGREVGDLFLKAVARRLTASVSEMDIIGRTGGDEFIFIITAQSSLESIISTIEKILEIIKQPFQINEYQLLVTGSIGFSIYPEDGIDASDLLRKSDAAMYRAKAAGRNSFQRYAEGMFKSSKNQIALENDLQNAIKANELVLFYQPIVDVATNGIVAVEALVRWNHPVLGLLPPIEFISIAEESDLILLLGEWVLFEACRQNKEWQDLALKPISVSVNLSGKQFKKQKVDELVEKVLKDSQLPPEFLILEVTESVIIENTEAVLVVMKRLKSLGISLSIDDFGTGYSSLSYLKKFPFDTLKIDRSFVKDLEVSGEDRKIVQAIIAMAKSLGLKIVAEGTESNEQFDFLKKNYCDKSQGYLFSKPVPANIIEDMLK